MSRTHRIGSMFVAFVAVVVSLAYPPTGARAQDVTSTDIKNQGNRKVKTSVKPGYPEVARQLHIAGTVRLEATVAADGHVRETKVVGGSPMLAQEAADTVKKWKYEEAPKETVEVVEVVYGNSK